MHRTKYDAGMEYLLFAYRWLLVAWLGCVLAWLVSCLACRRGLVAWLGVRAGDLDSSRASLSRKILRKHARNEFLI